MATVAIVLKTTKKLTKNEYAVALRVTHERQSQYFTLSALVANQSLPWRCSLDNWKPAEAEDNGLGKFRKTFIFYKECNEVLKAKLNEAQKILQRYDQNNQPFTFEGFESDLKHKEPVVPIVPAIVHAVVQPTTTLQEYYSQQILLLEEQGRVGQAGLNKEVQSIIRKFRPNALITDVNFRFLESFEYWLRNERKSKDTTISVKMRNLQRVINQAIEDKLIKRDDYPFGEKKYSINKRLNHKTRKIAIHLDKVGKLKALDLVPGTALHFAQQIFLFSYYCRGMNFIDITYLKWTDISATHIYYTRKKTGGQFEIPINEFNLTILSYFKLGGFVFPIIDLRIHKTLKQQYTRKKTALKAVNDGLKKLAAMIGEPTLKLTTNVGRHSYATGLKRSGANTSYITEALGHATQEQTQTYLDEFEKGVIECWENKMFQQ